MAFSKWTTRRIPTSGYKFSVDTINDNQLEALKQTISVYNEDQREISGKKKHHYDKRGQLRVKVMGRGPRKPYESYSGQYQSYLPYKYANYFDVYVAAMA